MNKKNLFFSLFLFILLPSLLIFAAGQEEAKEEVKQVIRIAFDAGDAKTLDPHRAATTVDRSTVDPIFNGLVRYPPGNQVNVEPDLAESWEVSKEKTVWTFRLRKGVYFHPFPGYPEGYELTSEDVVYSLRRAADPQHSSYAGEYSGMRFSAVDKYTVQITIDQSVSDTLFLAKVANYAGGFIVSKKAIEENGSEWFATHPVGTGPFRFDRYEPRQMVVLARNDKYFRGKPNLEKVIIRYMPDVSSREIGLQTGELDIIEGLNESKWVEKISQFEGVKAPSFGPCEVQTLHFNIRKSPFDNIDVRKAFSYAVSRKEVAAFMGETLAEPIYSPTLAPPAPGALTREEALKAGVVYEDNVEKAKELLTKAGYPNGFSTEVIISELATSYLKPMTAIQAQVKKAGIDMKLKVVDHASFHTLIREDASPLVYYACWRPNVDVFLTRFYHSDSEVVTGKKPDTNFSHYGAVDADGDGNVDNLDSLIEKARYELEPREQSNLWKEAQIELLKDVVSLPIIRLKYVFPMRTYVDLGHPLEFSWQTYSPQITEKTRILPH